MPEDRVTISADATQYFDVLSRAGVAADRLGASGMRAGEGFVRGERVIRTASANIASSLLMSGDAATTALVAMQGLERVFRIGIVPTIAVAAGVAVFQVLHAQVERTRKATEELGEELGKSLGLELQGSVESLGSDIDKLTAKMAALRKEMNSPTQKFIDLFDPNKLPQGLGGTAAGIKAGVPAGQNLSQQQKELIATEERLSKLQAGRADKELKIAEAKRDEDKISVLEIEYESKRKDLFQGAFKAGLNMFDLMKRLIALQITLNSEIMKEVNARHQSVAAATQRFKGSAGNLFKDIMSGQFIKDLRERESENAQTAGGQDRVRGFEEDIAKGIPIGPDAAAMVNAARAAAKKGGQDLGDVLNMDFSNLDMLSKYDFSGLAPLSGISIFIQ